VAGSTDSRRFPTEQPLQATLGGHIDAFVASLAKGGRDVVMSTFVWGRKDERLNRIADARTGASILVGRTTSTDFPSANPFQAALAGDIDGVVMKLEQRAAAIAVPRRRAERPSLHEIRLVDHGTRPAAADRDEDPLVQPVE